MEDESACIARNSHKVGSRIKSTDKICPPAALSPALPRRAPGVRLWPSRSPAASGASRDHQICSGGKPGGAPGPWGVWWKHGGSEMGLVGKFQRAAAAAAADAAACGPAWKWLSLLVGSGQRGS